jgi:LytS/YehU family sensor histidine kinase
MNHRMFGMIPHGNMHVPPEGFSSERRMFMPSPELFILKDLFSYFIPVIFSLAVRATESLIKTEAERSETEKRNLESELQHLRYQLQPHFFFNSLNNIYSLVDTSPTKAQEAIHNLSKLMRYLLYDTGREKVELSQEISFMTKYIQMMELRHTDKTKTTYYFPDIADKHYDIAPLLFIPLIENAYKHCVSATQPSTIYFEITVEGNILVFLSENTNFPKDNSDKSGSGIGLENLIKRLDLLYPHKYEFKYGVKDNYFRVRLKIEIEVNNGITKKLNQVK